MSTASFGPNLYQGEQVATGTLRIEGKDLTFRNIPIYEVREGGLLNLPFELLKFEPDQAD